MTIRQKAVHITIGNLIFIGVLPEEIEGTTMIKISYKDPDDPDDKWIRPAGELALYELQEIISELEDLLGTISREIYD